MNLDRFSRALAYEGITPAQHQQAITEAREEIKRDLVLNTAWEYVDDYNQVPDAEYIINFLCHIDLDHSLVEDALDTVKGVFK